MSGPLALTIALVLLALTLSSAVLRPAARALSEPVVAVVGAVVLIALGAISSSRAGTAIGQLGPTVGFLAALLLIAEGCRREGLFEAIGDQLAARCRNRPRRFLACVFAVASGVTIVLGLDATVVLLPPIVMVCARQLRMSPRAPLYACAHLANSASLLLPISNLTNLLAFRASGLSFIHFAALMALSTLAAVAVEWLALSRSVRVAPGDLMPSSDLAAVQADAAAVRPLPQFAVMVLAVTLVGFAASSPLGVEPVWFAVAGAVALNLPLLAGGARREAAGRLVQATEPGFLVFVLALGVIVAAAGVHGLTTAVRDVLPDGRSLPDLLLIAVVSGALANLVNNLPATLILVPVAGALGAGPVLAVLVGVNIGPNLTPVGSLATLLWRRVLAGAGIAVPAREFVWLGLLTVPPALVLATVLLWVSLQV